SSSICQENSAAPGAPPVVIVTVIVPVIVGVPATVKPGLSKTCASNSNTSFSTNVSFSKVRVRPVPFSSTSKGVVGIATPVAPPAASIVQSNSAVPGAPPVEIVTSIKPSTVGVPDTVKPGPVPVVCVT